jgi:NADH:ubiquinone oxidoreductase subunit 5 (subunit L)/multisubunit Na+/H+ antiporter MnhA subunit
MSAGLALDPLAALMLTMAAMALAASLVGGARTAAPSTNPARVLLGFAAVAIVCLSDSLWLLVAGWQLAGLAVGWPRRARRDAAPAVEGWIMASASSVPLVLATVALGVGLGTFDIAEIGRRAALAWPAGTPAAVLASLLIVIAALVRAGQMPLQMSLVRAAAMDRPLAVFQIAVLPTLGPFLLVRFMPLLSQGNAALAIAAGVGAVTLLSASSTALFLDCRERIIGAATAAQMGIAIVGIACGVPAWGMLLALSWGLVATLLLELAGLAGDGGGMESRARLALPVLVAVGAWIGVPLLGAAGPALDSILGASLWPPVGSIALGLAFVAGSAAVAAGAVRWWLRGAAGTAADATQGTAIPAWALAAIVIVLGGLAAARSLPAVLGIASLTATEAFPTSPLMASLLPLTRLLAVAAGSGLALAFWGPGGRVSGGTAGAGWKADVRRAAAGGWYADDALRWLFHRPFLSLSLALGKPGEEPARGAVRLSGIGSAGWLLPAAAVAGWFLPSAGPYLLAAAAFAACLVARLVAAAGGRGERAVAWVAASGLLGWTWTSIGAGPGGLDGVAWASSLALWAAVIVGLATSDRLGRQAHGLWTSVLALAAFLQLALSAQHVFVWPLAWLGASVVALRAISRWGTGTAPSRSLSRLAVVLALAVILLASALVLMAPGGFAERLTVAIDELAGRGAVGAAVVWVVIAASVALAGGFPLNLGRADTVARAPAAIGALMVGPWVVAAMMMLMRLIPALIGPGWEGATPNLTLLAVAGALLAAPAALGQRSSVGAAVRLPPLFIGMALAGLATWRIEGLQGAVLALIAISVVGPAWCAAMGAGRAATSPGGDEDPPAPADHGWRCSAAVAALPATLTASALTYPALLLILLAGFRTTPGTLALLPFAGVGGVLVVTRLGAAGPTGAAASSRRDRALAVLLAGLLCAASLAPAVLLAPMMPTLQSLLAPDPPFEFADPEVGEGAPKVAAVARPGPAKRRPAAAPVVSAQQVPQEEQQVGRALGEPPHEPRIPGGTVTDVDSYGHPVGGEIALRPDADAVEHLELPVAQSVGFDQPLGVPQDRRVVRGDGHGDASGIG